MIAKCPAVIAAWKAPLKIARGVAVPLNTADAVALIRAARAADAVAVIDTVAAAAIGTNWIAAPVAEAVAAPVTSADIRRRRVLSTGETVTAARVAEPTTDLMTANEGAELDTVTLDVAAITLIAELATGAIVVLRAASAMKPRILSSVVGAGTLMEMLVAASTRRTRIDETVAVVEIEASSGANDLTSTTFRIVPTPDIAQVAESGKILSILVATASCVIAVLAEAVPAAMRVAGGAVVVIFTEAGSTDATRTIDAVAVAVTDSTIGCLDTVPAVPWL